APLSNMYTTPMSTGTYPGYYYPAGRPYYGNTGYYVTPNQTYVMPARRRGLFGLFGGRRRQAGWYQSSPYYGTFTYGPTTARTTYCYGRAPAGTTTYGTVPASPAGAATIPMDRPPPPTP